MPFMCYSYPRIYVRVGAALFFFFFLRIRPPPNSTLFPYPTLFRFCKPDRPRDRPPPAFAHRVRNNASRVAPQPCGPANAFQSLGHRKPASDTSRHSARLFPDRRSEEHTSELQSPCNLVCRLLLEKK